MQDVAAYKRILLLTGDCLGVFTSKTAAVLLRYRGAECRGCPSTRVHAGQRLSDVIPGVIDRPILADVAARGAAAAGCGFCGRAPVGRGIVGGVARAYR